MFVLFSLFYQEKEKYFFFLRKCFIFSLDKWEKKKLRMSVGKKLNYVPFFFLYSNHFEGDKKYTEKSLKKILNYSSV